MRHAVGHARAGDHDRATLELLIAIDSAVLWLMCRLGSLKGWAFPPYLQGFMVEQVGIAVVERNHTWPPSGVRKIFQPRQLPLVPVFGGTSTATPGCGRPAKAGIRTLPRFAPRAFENVAQLMDGVGTLAVVGCGRNRWIQSTRSASRIVRGRAGSGAPGTQVAENTSFLPSATFDDGRTKDMPGIAERDLHDRQDLPARAEARGCTWAMVPPPHRARRADALRVRRDAVPFRTVGIGIQQRGRIQQHHRHQVRARLLDEDGPGETALISSGTRRLWSMWAWRPPVRQAPRARKGTDPRFVLPTHGCPASAAVQQAPFAAPGTVHGACHLARRTVEFNLHRLPPTEHAVRAPEP